MRRQHMETDPTLGRESTIWSFKARMPFSKSTTSPSCPSSS